MMAPRFFHGVLCGIFSVHTLARDIIFPPIAAVDQFTGGPVQIPLSDDNDPLFEVGMGSAGWGVTTYANLPHVNCLTQNVVDAETFDIAILGAPFDTGVTARPGARFGPTGIRLGSRRISPEFAWSPLTGSNVFKQGFKVVDCGDAPLTFLDNTVALKQLDKAHKILSTGKTNNTAFGTPRIITLGGDHTTTLPALRSVKHHWGKVSVVHFDSHIDTWDPSALMGGISDYAGVNHGTYLHIAHEEELLHDGSSIHVGIRGPFNRAKEDKRNDVRCGFDIITARDLDKIGTQGVVDRIKDRVKGTKVYITVDIDTIDPAFAPGTGTAEVGGWTTREILTILDGLEGLKVVGADVVEVSPVYDNAGETTVLAAAEVVQSLLLLMVSTPISVPC